MELEQRFGNKLIATAPSIDSNMAHPTGIQQGNFYAPEQRPFSLPLGSTGMQPQSISPMVRQPPIIPTNNNVDSNGYQRAFSSIQREQQNRVANERDEDSESEYDALEPQRTSRTLSQKYE